MVNETGRSIPKITKKILKLQGLSEILISKYPTVFVDAVIASENSCKKIKCNPTVGS